MMSLGSAFAALYVGHHVGDYWVQRGHDAVAKGKPGRDGQLACARHVASLTATQAVALAATAAVAGERLRPRKVAVGLAVNAASHYWADRRFTLAKLANHPLVNKGEFHAFGDAMAAPCGNGAHALDQSWHRAWLLVTALIIV